MKRTFTAYHELISEPLGVVRLVQRTKLLSNGRQFLCYTREGHLIPGMHWGTVCYNHDFTSP